MTRAKGTETRNFEFITSPVIVHSLLTMDPIRLVQDKFKRVDSITKERAEEILTSNSKEGNMGSPQFRILEPISPTKRRGSVTISTPALPEGRRKKTQRSTLPPSMVFHGLEREEARKQMKEDLLKEWKREDKLKYELLSAYQHTHRSLKPAQSPR